MLTSLGTAMLMTDEVPIPKLAPCALWERERPIKCTSDTGPFSGCDIGTVYPVCQFNWWLVAGVGVAALLLLRNQ
jgi:hypothetical protein